jgi:multicomponent Na+:H+ antiporter subunit E
MRLFLLNILLALLWAAVDGTFTFATFGFGFAVGYLVVLVARPVLGSSGYYTKLWQALGFMGYYVWELVLSSLRVAYDVLTPPFHMNPGIVRVPLDVQTDVQITILANLISLTPGTLSLDVSTDRKVLYIHAMYIDDDDVEALRREIKTGMERRVLNLLTDRGEEPVLAPTGPLTPKSALPPEA